MNVTLTNRAGHDQPYGLLGAVRRDDHNHICPSKKTASQAKTWLWTFHTTPLPYVTKAPQRALRVAVAKP